MGLRGESRCIARAAGGVRVRQIAAPQEARRRGGWDARARAPAADPEAQQRANGSTEHAGAAAEARQAAAVVAAPDGMAGSSGWHLPVARRSSTYGASAMQLHTYQGAQILRKTCGRACHDHATPSEGRPGLFRVSLVEDPNCFARRGANEACLDPNGPKAPWET